MHIKKNAAFIVTVLLSMLILAYVTYATVYEQIISQNNGFFNMIIFGAVLILVFIFITLIARVIGLRPNTEESVLTKYLVYFFVLCIFALFVFLRLKYTSSVPVNESVPYKTADYLYVGNLSEGKDVMKSLIYFPADFMYGVRIAVIFDLLGATKEAYYLMNIIFMVIASAFIYLTVEFISNKVCAVIATLVILFIPGNSFMVYSYSTEVFVSAYFYISLYFFCLLIFKRYLHSISSIIISIFCGLATGIVIWAEPVTIIAYIALFIYLVKSDKQSVACKISTFVFTVISFILTFFAKVIQMKVSAGEILSGFLTCFNPLYNRTTEEAVNFSDVIVALSERLNNPSRFLSENFYFLSDIDGNSFSANQAIWLTLADQLVYIFFLLLCVLCVVYILRASYSKLMPIYTTIILLFIGQILGGVNDVNYTYFTYLFVVVGSSTIFYMYLNHHREYATALINSELKADYEIKALKEGINEEESKDNSDDIKPEINSNELLRARALIFIGENEALYEQIKASERKDRINNPVAATQIYSSISETGEYETKEQAIEFFDEMDNINNVRPVNEVIAIPSSRPVEVVKPILADEIDSIIQEKPVLNETDLNTDVSNEVILNETEFFDEPDIKEPEIVNEPAAPSVEGFVFRKKEPEVVDSKKGSKKESKPVVKKESKPLLKKESKAEIKKEVLPVNKKEKSKKAPKDYKPGEPLDNPLPLPKPHVNKDLDFDFDVDVNDDFDW